VISVDQIAKLLVPGTGSCLLLALLASAALVCLPPPFPRAGRTLLAGTLLVYALLSTSPMRCALEQGLEDGFGSIRAAADAPSVGAIVVIGNGVSTHLHGGTFVDEMKGETIANVTEGARLFPLLGRPLVVVSGGIADPSQARTEADMMREALVAAGVAADRILLEGRSRNTYEQVLETSRIIRDHQVNRFVVVTAPTHMRRVLGVYRRHGSEPIPSVPLGPRPEPQRTRWPFSLETLEASGGLSYEYIAIAGYWLRGRI
jgi:uncharacterized SAM-binding protein YcdF (DUF218 family)